MFVVAVARLADVRGRLFVMVIVQVVHDHVHRYRRAQKHEDDEGEKANGGAAHGVPRRKAGGT